jgi:RNA polymerase sigma-70 factor (ECF subfamily)
VEEDAFVALYRAHGPDVWRFARRRCGSAEEADDATAETFATAWRRRPDLPPAGEARLWLLGTARRVLANQHRSAHRRDGLDQRLALVRPEPGPADPAEVVGDADPLWSALASLPDDQRDLLLMRACDGLAVQDIAVLLGCTPNAASIRLTRARDALAAALGRKDRAPSRTSAGRDPDDGGGTDDRP